MLARTLPAFLFGPIAGSLVDRLDRKKIMIAADLGRATLYLSMAFIEQLWAIYLLSFVIECLSLLWTPARDASLPNLVPRRQLANANSLVLVSAYATLPLGGAAFAVLYGVAQSIERARAAVREPARVARARVRRRRRSCSRRRWSRASRSARCAAAEHERMDLSRVWRDTRDGIRFLREDSIASAMTGGIVIAFGAVGAVLALGADLRGDDGPRRASPGWGLVVTAFGVGMALGMASANQAARIIERDRVFVWSLLAAAGRADRAGRDAEPRRGPSCSRCGSARSAGSRG